uniref:Uncharacterized protein n=1 Tax=Arundo donax TaxID=35708 RepID=A0A0A9H8W3_ARUDO
MSRKIHWVLDNSVRFQLILFTQNLLLYLLVLADRVQNGIHWFCILLRDSVDTLTLRCSRQEEEEVVHKERWDLMCPRIV